MKQKASLLIVCGILVLCTVAHSARVRRQTLSEIVKETQSVILGRVLGSQTRVGPEGKMVWTDYRIEVQRTMLGGERSPVVTVSFAGGRHGDLDVGIAGVPVLETGRTYVLFLRQDKPYPVPTVGWGQGLFRVLEVEIEGVRRTVLISEDDEPLEMTGNDKIRRGPRLEVRDGGVRALPAERVSSAELPRQPEPDGRNADGTAALPAQRVPAASRPLPERRFATLDDLQRFLSGKLAEIEVKP